MLISLGPGSGRRRKEEAGEFEKTQADVVLGSRVWRQGCQLASSFLKPPGCLAELEDHMPKQFS